MRYYTEEHEWIEIENGTAIIGISKHAADELGDITFVELPEDGDHFEKGDVLAVVESVKAASDIYSPLEGDVSAVNSDLEDNPGIINESAEEKGWICKLEGVSEDACSDFMTAEKYQEFIAE